MTEDISNNRPLVTFALFAYNQEQYIREAVEGAFCQTYEPLEIILSDDCSTDRTFEIMQEMARKYHGPHLVKVKRNAKNLGLVEHINVVANTISSKIVIVAAGDDVSSSLRTEITVLSFDSAPNSTAVFCNMADSIQRMPNGIEKISIREISAVEIFMNAGGAGRGAGYAYRSSVFSWGGKLPLQIKSEDKFLPARAALMGSVIEISERLVFYRRHSDSLTESLRNQREFAHQRIEHWEEISKILELAYRENKVSTLKYKTIMFCMNLSRRYKNEPSKTGVFIGFFGARLIRRILRKKPIIFYA